LNELENVKEFEHLYSSSNCLDWFLNETFLYRLLIKSLHTFNIQLIYHLRFFLQDIHQQLINCPTVSSQVYKGLLMRIDQIEFLNQSSHDKILRFNSFIIANQNFDHILNSLQNSPNTNGLHKVLFEIEINQIGKQYKQYIIFPINTSFTIVSIQFQKRIWIVKINVFNSKQSINNRKKTPIQFAHHLRQIGLFHQSEELFYLFLDQYPSLYTQCYDGLGRISQDKGLYQTSLDFYIKSIQRTSSTNHSHSLNNIGCAHYYLEQYQQALQYYSEALTLMKNEIDQSMCLNNMGVTYAKNNQYEEALQCFEHSLAIRKIFISQNDPEIGISYTNIGVLRSSLGQFDVALEYYNNALKCFSASNSMLSRAIVYQNMAKIFQEKHLFDRSLKFYQDALNTLQQIQPLDHPNLIHIKQQIDHLNQINQFVF
jgi:tetratricopeptide (TPR) repeat protein